MVASAILYLLWGTRSSAIPGVYHANGVFGSSTLTLRSDHTFTQELNLVNEHTQQAEEPKVITGQWQELGRRNNLFDQEIVIRPFIGFAPWNQGKIYEAYGAAYGPVALTGLGIEIDIGASIVYRK